MDIAETFSSIVPRYPELSGRVAVVTGSSRGIGQGVALRLAREGMRLVITSRTAQAVEATARELAAVGAEALPVVADISRTEGIRQLMEATLAAYGTLDLLVNNAANLRRIPLPQVDDALVDDELATNIRAPLLLSQRAAAVMGQAGHGCIVHISSVGGLRGHLPGLPYDVTKGAIDAMTRAMAIELAPRGIRVDAVAPGATRTERWGTHHRARKIAARIPLGRFGTVLEIGAAVAFLASDDAAYITGQVIYVDGGITAQLSPPGQPL